MGRLPAVGEAAIPALRRPFPLARPLGGLAVAALLLALAELGFRWGGVAPLSAGADPFAGFSRQARVFRLDAQRGRFVTDPRAERHSFNHQEFLASKPAAGLRLFFLGGSSLYGFPWGAQVAFPAPLGRALARSYPGRTVEAVNAGGMSYGSHRMRILAHEVLEYAPDLLVLYEGHNEFVEERLHERLLAGGEAVGRLRGALHHSRLYSAMARFFQARGWVRGAAAASASPGSGPQPAGAGELLGFDVDREEGRGVRAPEREQVRARFEENLRAIARMARERGVGVVLCTVAVNLRDWPPNESLFPQEPGAEAARTALALLAEARERLKEGDPQDALARLEEAARLAPGHAGIQFERGRALEAAGRPDEARRSYEAARDADAQPSRAPGSFNETIRRVAAEEGALLVDVEAAVAAAAPSGLVGFNLLEDYVHPKPATHRLIAKTIWSALLERGVVGPVATADPALFDEAAGPLEAEVATAQAGTSAALYNTGFLLEHQGLAAEAIAKYQACLALSPDHFAARFNLARLLHASRRPDLALPHFERALALRPGDARARAGYAMALLGTGSTQEARAQARQAVEGDPRSAQARCALGYVQAATGDLEGAGESFVEAMALDPEDPIAPAGLGAVHLAAGRPAEALAPLRQSLAISPDQPQVTLHLAAGLALSGDLEGSERLYRRLLTADPTMEEARRGLDRVVALRAREAP